MFLKRAYGLFCSQSCGKHQLSSMFTGSGYHLIVEYMRADAQRTPEQRQAATLELIRSFCPNVSASTSVGNEITYLLPEEKRPV